MEDNNTYFIISKPKDKPIKIVIEDNIKITSNGNVIEIKKHLSSMEAEKLLNDIFGTTNIGIIDIIEGASNLDIDNFILLGRNKH